MRLFDAPAEAQHGGAQATGMTPEPGGVRLPAGGVYGAPDVNRDRQTLTIGANPYQQVMPLIRGLTWRATDESACTPDSNPVATKHGLGQEPSCHHAQTHHQESGHSLDSLLDLVR